MQDLAPIEQQTAPATQKPSKERRIPRRIVQAIDMLLSGEARTQKAAAEAVGLSAEHLCRTLSKDHIRVFCDRRARQTIGNAGLRASRRLVELVDAGSEHVSLDATARLLEIIGIKPQRDANVNVNVAISAGYVIDLSERKPGNEQIIEHNQCDVRPPAGETD